MPSVANYSAEYEARCIRKICCIGAGYVGGSTCSVIAYKCPDIRVTIVDTDPERIAQWNSHTLPIHEPGLEELISICRGRNLFFTQDIALAISEADLVFLCVNTPSFKSFNGTGQAIDLRNIESAINCIASVSTSDKLIVEKSTVPCHTSDLIEKMLFKKGQPGTKFHVLSNPEFLSEGTAINDLLDPDRILIGGRQDTSGIWAQAQLASIYSRWVPVSKIITMDLWSAELGKLASNAMLAQRISSVNALSAICEQTGASIRHVTKAIGTDHRIGDSFINPSLGFGGSCFQKDILELVYMCESLDLLEIAEYWRQILIINEYQKIRFTRRIISKMLDTTSKKHIAIFGVAFKNGTGDTREAAALTVIKYLLEMQTNIHIYDPKVKSEQISHDIERIISDNNLAPGSLIEIHTDPYSATNNVDGIAICTEWEEFKSLDYQAIYDHMSRPAFIFDGRLILDVDKLTKIGFHVEQIGRQ